MGHHSVEEPNFVSCYGGGRQDMLWLERLVDAPPSIYAIIYRDEVT